MVREAYIWVKDNGDCLRCSNWMDLVRRSLLLPIDEEIKIREFRGKRAPDMTHYWFNGLCVLLKKRTHELKSIVRGAQSSRLDRASMYNRVFTLSNGFKFKIVINSHHPRSLYPRWKEVLMR